jgi:hypothetical protein
MNALARWTLIVLLTSFLGCTVYKERPATSFAGATGGEGLEQVFWKSVKAKQWVEVERIVASNFVGVGPEGKVGAAAWLEQMKQIDLKDYSIGDLQVALNGNTVVVSYNIMMNGTRGGQVLPSTPVHRMSVWQQQKSGWVLIAQAVG